MLSMWLAGRLIRHIDEGILVLVGLGLVSQSLYHMSGFNLQVGQQELVTTGFVQGLGLGLMFIPVSNLAYSTLPPKLRGEATALFSLSRNLGSSVGVSIVMAALTRNIWINRQELGARMQITPELLSTLPPASDAQGLPVALVNEVARKAAEIAYVNDFYLLMWICLCTMPMVFFLAGPKTR